MSTSDLMLDVGQANELKLAFRRAEWTNDEIKKLCEGNVLADVRNVLRDLAEIKPIEHVIDCDADPFVPEGWKVKEHRKGGLWKWDEKYVILHLSKFQKKGGISTGNDLRKELENKPVLNANVLDYLLAHPHLIPEKWKGKSIFFWGTIYRDPDGDLNVRYLCWGGDGWCWRWRWLQSGWLEHCPAALRAQSAA